MIPTFEGSALEASTANPPRRGLRSDIAGGCRAGRGGGGASKMESPHIGGLGATPQGLRVARPSGVAGPPSDS